MPVMNFDLEDGKPLVSFTLKPDDCVRFIAFMEECQNIKNGRPALQEQATNAPRSSSEPVANPDEPWGIRDDKMGFLRTFKTEYARDQFYSVAADRYVDSVLFGPLAAPPALSPPDNEAKLVCFEAYHVVGSLLLDLGRTEAPEAEKILDNLSQARMVHRDVLPWPSYAQPESVAGSRLDAERLDWLEQRHWGRDEAFELVENWRTKDGRRYPQGLRSAIDAARSAEEPK